MQIHSLECSTWTNVDVAWQDEQYILSFGKRSGVVRRELGLLLCMITTCPI